MLDFIGGAIGKYIDMMQADENRADAANQRSDNYVAQKEFAQHGIRWKVEDAKAAGLHPVFALGGSGAAYSPNPVTVMEDKGRSFSEMGQDFGRSLQAQETEEEREKRKLGLALLRSQVSESDARASYYNSLAAREAQTARVTKPMPPAVVGGGMPTVGFTDKDESYLGHSADIPGAAFDRVKIEPSKTPSSRFEDFSTAAGTAPFWREFDFKKDGTKIVLPWTEEGPGEAMENVPWWAWPTIVIPENVRRYGWRWIPDSVFGRNDPPRGPTVSGKIRR